MNDLQAAVLACLDPTADAALKHRALAYCNDIRTSDQGWVFVLQHLSLSMKPEVAFWSLTVIHEVISNPSRYPHSLSSNQRSAVPSTLLTYMAHATYPERFHTPDSSTAVGSQPQQLPSFLLNKLAQLIVAVIAADYPHNWPTAFNDCILPLVGHASKSSNALNSTFATPFDNAQVTVGSVSMFLRLLRAIDDDVTSVRAAQVSQQHRLSSVRVKDAMRDDCVTEIVRVCIELIREPKFASQAFDIIARYIEWIDVGLIVQAPILKPMYEAITATTACPWRAAAAAALRAIVQKRMAVSMKAKLLRMLDIDALLRAIRTDVILVTEDGSVDSEAGLQSGYTEVASLVNAITMVALDCVKLVAKVGGGSSEAGRNGKIDVSTSAAEVDAELLVYVGDVARHAMPVALQMLDENSEEGNGGAQTLECVATYVNVYGQLVRSRAISVNHENVSVIGAILQAIGERGRFPNDVDPTDENSERGRAFTELRQALLNRVFCSIARLFTEFCVQFVKDLYSQQGQAGGGSVNSVSRAELALVLVASLISVGGDDVRVQEICALVLASPPECMQFSVVSGHLKGVNGRPENEGHLLVQEHLLELVSSSYFEIVGRSAKILIGDSEGRIVSAVLKVIFDERGLGHLGSEMVRSKAAMALVKISKPLRGMMSDGHVEAIVRAGHDHTFPVEEDIKSQRWKNQMLIFETVGYLLGTAHNRETNANNGGGSRLVQLVYMILKRIVEGVLSREGMSCVAYIGAAGYLSKGFGGDSKYMTVDSGKGKVGTTKGVTVVMKNDKKGALGEEDVMMKRVWVECVEGVLKGSEGCLTERDEGWMVEMRLKVIFFLHRMVDTVGRTLTWYLERVVPQLVQFGTSAVEMQQVVSLLSQSAIRFRESFVSVTEKVEATIVQRLERISFKIDEKSGMAVSEEDRELVQVVRALMYWVNVMVNCGLMDRWWPGNGNEKQLLLKSVMNWVMDKAVGEDMDVRVAASVMRMAWQTIGLMIDRWGGKRDQFGGMDDFVMDRVGQGCVECLGRGTLFQKGGGYWTGEAGSVVTEVVRVQNRCMGRYGARFADILYNNVSKSMGRTGKQAVSQLDWNVYLTDLTKVALSSTFEESVQRWIVMTT